MWSYPEEYNGTSLSALRNNIFGGGGVPYDSARPKELLIVCLAFLCVKIGMIISKFFICQTRNWKSDSCFWLLHFGLFKHYFVSIPVLYAWLQESCQPFLHFCTWGSSEHQAAECSTSIKHPGRNLVFFFLFTFCCYMTVSWLLSKRRKKVPCDWKSVP